MRTQTMTEAGILAVPKVDQRAYAVAALTAAAASLLAGLVLFGVVFGDPGFMLRVEASLVMGPSIIPATAGDSPLVLAVGLLVHCALVFVYAGLIVIVVHRWGLAVGFIGGAVLGVALYIIGVYAVSYFFPWIYPLRNWIFLASHMILGALVGFVYEMLDSYDAPFPTGAERQGG